MTRAGIVFWVGSPGVVPDETGYLTGVWLVPWAGGAGGHPPRPRGSSPEMGKDH